MVELVKFTFQDSVICKWNKTLLMVIGRSLDKVKKIDFDMGTLYLTGQKEGASRGGEW